MSEKALEYVLLGLEFRVDIHQTLPLPVYIAALHAGLILGGVGAEGDEAGAVAVVNGGLDGPGVHAAHDGVQDDAAVGGEAGDRLVDNPGGAHAPVEHAHVGNGPHPGVPGLNGGLDGVHAAGAADQVGTGVDMEVDGPLHQV